MDTAFNAPAGGGFARYRALCRCLAAMKAGSMRTRDGEGRETTVEVEAAFQNQIASIGAGLTDADLLRAYRRTDVEPKNPEADALLTEIERRGLDT